MGANHNNQCRGGNQFRLVGRQPRSVGTGEWHWTDSDPDIDICGLRHRSADRIYALMAKILRQIVSDGARIRGDLRERSRHIGLQQLRQERERNDTLLRPDGAADVANGEQQQGRRLSRAEVVRRIHKLNPKVWYEQSKRYPKQGGLYIEDKASPYGKRMVVGMPHEIVNEFSTVLTKPSLIPDMTIAAHWQKIQQVDARIPGWRTVLYKLMVENLITLVEAEREFKISEGRSSQFWQTSVN